MCVCIYIIYISYHISQKYTNHPHTHTGYFTYGVKHGYGIYTWSIYGINIQIIHTHTGYFAFGVKHGYGIYTWSTGDTYEGEYVDDFKQGYHIWDKHTNHSHTWSTGDTYEGEYVDDFKQGYQRLCKKTRI